MLDPSLVVGNTSRPCGEKQALPGSASHGTLARLFASIAASPACPSLQAPRAAYRQQNRVCEQIIATHLKVSYPFFVPFYTL
jgi:hypothetical protein